MTKPTALTFTEAEQARIFEAARTLGTTQVELIKWGALQAATRAWSAACVVEAWIFLSNEDEAAKVDLAALRADIDALGGTEGASAAAAAPVDHEGLLHELAGVIRDCVSSGRNDVTELLAWVASHGL